MLLTNIIVVLLLIGFVGAGMKDGFIQTLGRLVGAVIGFIAARLWFVSVSAIIAPFMPSGWARLVAFIVIFIVITRLVGFAFKLVDGMYKILSFLPFLKSINSLLGALLGLLEGFILLGGAIYLIVTFKLVPSLTALLTASSVAMWVETVFHSLLSALL